MPPSVSLSILDRVGVASPCTADWEHMTGDDRVRFCGQCRLNVYNLSAMTEAQAAAFVAQREGRACIRLYRRADGTMLTRDCPVGLRALRLAAARSIGRIAAAMGLLLGGAAMLGSAKNPFQARVRQLEPFATLSRWLAPSAPIIPPGGPIMGDMCITPVVSPTTQGGR